jgi:hypothetical protein
MVNGHPNLVKISSYKNLVVIIAVLVMSVFTSTHLVALFVVTRMYLFLVNLLVGLIRLIMLQP